MHMHNRASLRNDARVWAAAAAAAACHCRRARFAPLALIHRNRAACSAPPFWFGKRAHVAFRGDLNPQVSSNKTELCTPAWLHALVWAAATMPAALSFLLPVGPEDCDCTVVLLPPPQAAVAEAEAEALSSSPVAGSTCSSSSQAALQRETRQSCERQRTRGPDEGTPAAVAGTRLPACSVLLKSYSPLFRCNLGGSSRAASLHA